MADPTRAPVPMDDEMATRPVVPEVWVPSQAKDRPDGGLALIQRTIIRHRLEEAAMAAEFQARVLEDIHAIAGAENGIGAAARARIQDASTQADKLEEHIRDLGVDVRLVKDGRAES